ncbi:metallophosphoesterase family protein [Leeuwenhoekiella sp. MAR_2009_132]|uniref:metallophosphoesterase family protein n=1 Tax=Leeuwenhoekiella sp. MAR_2009_132 TaxID=1392489 RepID=UPI00048D417A|nr:metallophosphoesterase [Leeuwenhoekiella sp. MAR_2009_132]
MNSSHLSRRNSLKLFALTGTTILAMPNLLLSCDSKRDFKIRFGILTDSHYANREPVGTRFYKDSIPKMREAIATLSTQKLDFLIHLGDFKDQDAGAKTEDTLGYLKKIEAVFQEFEGANYHALGNHDVDSITKEQFLKKILNTGQQIAQSYYAYTANGMQFIVLDANYDADGTSHHFAEGSDWENATIPKKEVDWFANLLANSDLPTVVFCHHPLYEYYKEGSKFHVTNYAEIQQLMEANGNVIACFHGHVHAEDLKEINGIHYITQLGMVDYEGLENNTFSLVEITPNQLKIEGYKRASNKHITL